MGNFMMGVLFGIFLGFIGAVVTANTIAKPFRERAMYSQGVRDGMEGKFEIQITKQEVLWRIAPIDSTNKEK